jgi:uncharacterized protein involved in exopolysaccharide biosynthesis
MTALGIVAILYVQLLILYREYRMADQLQAIKDGIAALQASIAAEITRITASLNAADPAGLQASIADAVSQLNALKASVDAVDPAAPAPVAPTA